MRGLNKNIVFMVLSCFVLISLLSGVPVAMAATTVTVDIGEATGYQGENVTVPITIDTTGDTSDNSVRAFSFDIVYDRAKLTYVDVTTPVNGVNLNANNNAKVGETTVLRVAYMNFTQNTVPDGIVVNLNFKIIDTGAINQQQVDITWNSAPSITPGSGITIDSVVNTSGFVTIPIAPVAVETINVTGAGGATTIETDGGTLQMNAEVLPANATDKSVTWSVTAGTGQATIDQNGLLTAVKNGTVTVKATANDGSGISGTQEITISNQTIKVTAITVTGQNGASTIATDGGNLQMIANVQPADATNKTVTWSVENGTGSATIDASGLLTATGNGTVTVKATANDGSGIVGQTVITISGQLLPPSAGLTTPFFVLSAGNDTVTPQRAQNTPQYQTEVDYTVDTITVTPTAAVGTIKVNGNVVASGVASGAINLNVGANPITITVQEDGKAAKTYTITVTRLAANANANLNDLTVDGNSVANFDSAVLTYNVKLPFGTTVVPTVVGTATDAKATVQVTPATNLSGTEIERTTTVTVTAQDGTTKKTYKVIFEVAKQFTVTANKTTVGNRQHVTVNVANAGVATSATIILALYDTSTANVNDMKALIFKEGPIAGGNNPGILTGGFIVPTNYTIKAFVWDDFNSQKALSDVAIP